MEVVLNGVFITIEEQGEGVPLVLVHGFPLSHAMWQEQLAVAGQGGLGPTRLIVLDMRGFGASEVPPGPYDMETYADDLVALLDLLELEQAVVGGLSMGGYVTFAFLRRYPERVRGLVLANTRATADSDEARANRETNAQMVEAQGSSAIADKMLPNLLSPDAPPEQHASLRRIIERNHPQGIMAALRGMALRSDSTDLLPHIRVPTLVIGGEHDALTPPDAMRELQAAIPGSQLAMLPGAGHVSNRDNPAAFNAAIAEFMRQF